jgi:NTE family protein
MRWTARRRRTLVLANLQSGLKRLDRTTQERLINWGYAICDTGMRRWVVSGASRPANVPFSTAGLG